MEIELHGRGSMMQKTSSSIDQDLKKSFFGKVTESGEKRRSAKGSGSVQRWRSRCRIQGQERELRKKKTYEEKTNCSNQRGKKKRATGDRSIKSYLAGKPQVLQKKGSVPP